jgi:hypothetical protein
MMNVTSCLLLQGAVRRGRVERVRVFMAVAVFFVVGMMMGIVLALCFPKPSAFDLKRVFGAIGLGLTIFCGLLYGLWMVHRTTG